MIQPVPPIVALPSVIPSPSVIAVQNASSQVDVATGPLPEPTAADASTFKDAANGVEASKIQEVDMQRLAPANQVWSHASKSLSESLNGMSTLEESVNQSLRDYQKPSGSKFVDRSGDTSGPDGTDGSSSSSSSSSGTSALLDQLSDNMRKTFQDSLRMMQFTITADLMSKSSSDTIGSVKQLANGGGGG